MSDKSSRHFAIDSYSVMRARLLDQSLRVTDVVSYYLDRIEKINPKINAYAEVYEQEALAKAEALDALAPDALETLPLAGMPIALKDNLCTDYGHTTCSSKMLATYRSPFTATAVARLEDAGAIILGKTNMDEFAMGSSSEHGPHGGVKNPWDNERVPGGSSGGSAAAVSAGLCMVALGSDTGGSIRQPAALCGAVGYKPTYGRVSRYGLVAFASSLDQIGPFSQHVEDAVLVTGVMGGTDAKDSTCAPEGTADLLEAYQAILRDEALDLGQLKVGIVSEYMSASSRQNMSPACLDAFDQALEKFEKAGAKLVEIHLPHAEYAIPVYYLVATSEASSNLARFDGVHFGHRAELTPEDDIVNLFAKSRAEGFGEEVQRRIMLGNFALSSGYYDAYYNKALKVRRLLHQDFDKAFSQCDVILTPTTIEPAFKAGEKSEDPLAMYLNDFFTVAANLTGVPAIHIPTQFQQTPYLPVGVQLMAATMQDAALLKISHHLSKTLNFEIQLPPL